MSAFQRTLNLKQLGKASKAGEPWLMDLLEHWVPTGHAAPMQHWEQIAKSKRPSGPRPMGLRLAIRNGYMNFYCGGQSVAKVTLGPRTLKAETHWRYLGGSNANGKTYLVVGKNGPDLKLDILPCMIRTHGYQGAEKLFVEDVCAVNGRVIDLEIGLPGLKVKDSTTGTTQTVSPRIDLAALKPDGSGWKVVFWEAKLPSDPGVRSHTVPKVIAQLEKYNRWFREAGEDAVVTAYRNSCALLNSVHDYAQEQGCNILPLDDAIVAIAKDPGLLTGSEGKVRLLIDQRQYDKGFEPHLAKLEENSVPVYCVHSDAELTLPAELPAKWGMNRPGFIGD